MLYVTVSEAEGENRVELPLEEDSTLLLTTLKSAFPNACGLVFSLADASSSSALRGVRLADGRFHPPQEGWENKVFLCTTSREEKRPSPNNDNGPPSKKAHMISDLIILGLPWKTTEEQIKHYFQQFGEVAMVTIKRNQRTGMSKGFGFVRFAEFSSQCKVIGQRHHIDGRWCDVKIPYSQAVDSAQSCKVFVGQLKTGVTQEEIKEHFSDYGDVTDIYIPQPFRQFCFVTFADAHTAKAVCAYSNHSIKGSPVNVSVAIPPSKKPEPQSPMNSIEQLNDFSAGRMMLKRRYSDIGNQYLEQQWTFSTSSNWNAKQGRNSLLWDENSFLLTPSLGSTVYNAGYTTGQDVNF